MKSKIILRLISLMMFAVAVVFVAVALSNPQLGSVFYIGDFAVGADIWRKFYLLYTIVMVVLFILSFIIKPKKEQ